MTKTSVGLQLVTRDSNEKLNNIVIKSLLKPNRSNPTISELCFLKTCHLCLKQLHQDKDVYMYRGDLGFCSRECRESQILIDDRKELEASTKLMLASYRRCNSGAGKSESRSLLNDLRRRRRLFIVP
ncbi:FCS-Like Zinc finger 18 [Cardamine amara subsp. amara]|uniref:FCS-Like Zinc finger 18 n=1 Tax=Cardamine amara subsp. amara TaxID=228776 RepID=A0ABD1BNZ2_CARAN